MSRFEDLATSDPARLVELVRAGMPPHDLTYAAEALGQAPAAIAVPILMGLLEHESSLVREGAVYGLVTHLDDPVCAPGIVTKLSEIAAHDPSPGVRAAASDVEDDGGERVRQYLATLAPMPDDGGDPPYSI